MRRSTKRLLLFVLALPPLLAVLAVVYGQGMAWLEGEPRTFWRCLETVVETLTTTGFGADDHWDHPAMALFMIVLQLAGLLTIFLVFPIYLLPLMEERFEARIPSRAPARLRDHIVIYRYGAAVASLVLELEESGIPYVIIEEDRKEARHLLDQGRTVILRALDDERLPVTVLRHARALIANGTDDENATAVLAARQLGFEGEILALVEEVAHRRPMILAGASAVFDPRHILGVSLAARASQRIHPVIAGVQQIGRHVKVCEIRVEAESPLAGRTLSEAQVGPRTGATVIGQWIGGTLMAHPSADMRIEPNALLVAAGDVTSVENLGKLAGPRRPLLREGPIVVAGYGEVGAKVVQVLRDAGDEVRVVDREAREGVDVAGDVRDPDVLVEAGAREAQTVVLALDTDSATLFTTVIMKDLAPRVPVVARVNSSENLRKIHLAGADYALSISEVAGRMLARRLLGREELAVDQHIKVLKVSDAGLAGRRPAELDLRRRTGCSVVAVERGEEVLAGSDPEFQFEPGDSVFICGTNEAIARYHEIFPQPSAKA